MAEWTEWFRFRGEIGRRAYAVGCIAALATMFVVGIALFLVGYLSLEGLGMAGVVPAALMPPLRRMAVPLTVLVVAIPYLWVLTALAAKRARQAGLYPAVLVPAWWALNLLDNLVLGRLTTARLMKPLDDMTPLGGILILGVFLALLLWPGRRERTAPARHSAPLGAARATFGLRD